MEDWGREVRYQQESFSSSSPPVPGYFVLHCCLVSSGAGQGGRSLFFCPPPPQSPTQESFTDPTRTHVSPNSLHDNTQVWSQSTIPKSLSIAVSVFSALQNFYLFQHKGAAMLFKGFCLPPSVPYGGGMWSKRAWQLRVLTFPRSTRRQPLARAWHRKAGTCVLQWTGQRVIANITINITYRESYRAWCPKSNSFTLAHYFA